MNRVLRSFVVALALVAAARAQGDVPEALRDDRGAAIDFRSTPRRIVSLLPSLTESVCAIGACALLVGTDRFSNWPASVSALPKLGGLDDARIEPIVALKPDLVLVSGSARVVDRLEALGLTVVVLQSNNHADVKHALDVLGLLLHAQPAAGRVWADIERQTQAASLRVPTALRGKRVYFEIDAAPYAAGKASFIGETLSLIGMANAVPADLGPFPKLNPEYVIRIQPDIVMSNRQSIAEMPRRPGWSSLHAFERGQTCGFSGPQYELLIRPGPRMGEAADVLATCLAGLPRR